MKRSEHKNQKGFALVEALAFLFVFITLAAYTIDFFAAIHTAIVNSIAARTYLFETLQHRSYPHTLRSETDARQFPTLDFSNAGQRFQSLCIHKALSLAQLGYIQ